MNGLTLHYSGEEIKAEVAVVLNQRLLTVSVSQDLVDKVAGRSFTAEDTKRMDRAALSAIADVMVSINMGR